MVIADAREAKCVRTTERDSSCEYDDGLLVQPLVVSWWCANTSVGVGPIVRPMRIGHRQFQNNLKYSLAKLSKNCMSLLLVVTF